MKNILVIESSPIADESYSRRAVRNILQKLQAKYPDAITQKLDLVESPPAFLSQLQISSFFSAAADLSEKQRHSNEQSNAYIAQVMVADIIVIGFPVWNFGIPASLKAWIDQIVRVGVTF